MLAKWMCVTLENEMDNNHIIKAKPYEILSDSDDLQPINF